METTLAPPPKKIIYPSGDGKPMAEGSEQYDWLTLIKDNLEVLYENSPDVLVAGDMFWYPVEGDNKTRLAPDVMVALWRPKGRRDSYLQWNEGGAPPQVVFEVLSPGNRRAEMESKFLFFQKHGVEEYYLHDPRRKRFTVYLRDVLTGLLEPVNTGDFISPRLGVRFVQAAGKDLEIYHPNGEPFRSLVETNSLRRRADYLRGQAEHLREQADYLRGQAEARAVRLERERTEAEERAERFAEKLRALGIDPDAV